MARFATIIKQPHDVVALENSTVRFEIIATSGYNIEYEWYSTKETDPEPEPGSGQMNKPFYKIEGEYQSVYEFTATQAAAQRVYKCRLSDPFNSQRVPVWSDIITLTITDHSLIFPEIKKQPTSISVNNTETATFAMEVKGDNLTFACQTKKENEDWSYDSDPSAAIEISEIDEQTHLYKYSITGNADNNGKQYRFLFNNDIGSADTVPVSLSVLLPPVITKQPQSVNCIENTVASFEVEATGHDLLYQWETSVDGETWRGLTLAAERVYSFYVSLALNNTYYRCKVYNDGGAVYSNAVILNVTSDDRLTPPIITSHPSSVSAEDGQPAAFSVTADGENLHYQWQTYQNETWYNIANAESSAYTITAALSLNRKQYRCQVSNAAGAVYSNFAYLYVASSASLITTPTITNQPLSISKLEAQTATFRIVARGGSLSYQWQIKRGNSWYDITGATNPIYSTRASTSLNNTQYRCRVSNSAGTVYSSSATLTVRELGPLPMYGYHSIIISGKNTYGEWEMYPTSRPHVAPPEVKTSYVDVPGADGGLDYTELLNEKPNYGYRKGSWEFLLIPQERWPDVYRSLCNYLHGREHTVVLEDDPNVMYTGRLSVNQWQSAAHNSLITIDYILDPEAINTQDESYNPDELGLEAAERILRRPENLDCVLSLVNDQITIVPVDSLYEDGDNIAY